VQAVVVVVVAAVAEEVAVSAVQAAVARCRRPLTR
jgi:hypothetical protein